MHEAAYGDNSLIYIGCPQGADARGVQNDSDPFWKENKIPKAVLCIVAMMLSYWIIGFAGSTTRLNSD
jgi:hypothetical protein